MLTVPEAARRVGRNPETVRRWIRSGKLRSQRVGTQYLVDEEALDAFLDEDRVLPYPPEWKRTWTGEPPINPVRAIRLTRLGR
ncbi:MAG: helix-turn-helix domain-containing protein [Actinomycetota bacterium]